MKRIGIAVVSVFLLFVCIGTSNATVLDFDDLSSWGTVPEGYGGLGWNASWWSFSEEPPNYTAYSHPIAVTSYDNMNGVSWTGLNYVGFQDPGTFQGAYFSGYGQIGYDLYYSNAKVSSTPDISINGTPLFIASNYTGLVDVVYIRGTQSYFAMDNFTFNTAVPIPPTFLLLATALGGLVAARRRFTK